jgi:hypothetical protein
LPEAGKNGDGSSAAGLGFTRVNLDDVVFKPDVLPVGPLNLGVPNAGKRAKHQKRNEVQTGTVQNLLKFCRSEDFSRSVRVLGDLN